MGIMDTKNKELIKVLGKIGIRMHKRKVNASDVRKIFGAVFRKTEWSNNKNNMPREITTIIEKEELKANRVVLPTSYIANKYGLFLNKSEKVCVCGIVYQYTLYTNPRHIRFAYKLFLENKTIAKNSNITTAAEAEMGCDEKAKELIESELFDIYKN